MLSIDTFSIYIMLCVLAPLLGAFTLLFLFIFEKRIDLLENQKREIALERELQTALYNQLNMEIEPHFFFNTLNSILSLARLDRKKDLVRSIEALSKLLKFKYQASDAFFTINEELTYINYYLEIQKIRFRDRLHIDISADPTIKDAVIIPFLIQTLIENAFKHAFEKNVGDAFLNISIEKKQNVIEVAVWNNTNHKDDEIPHERGLGLENIVKRLCLLFPNDNPSVTLSNLDDGTTVTAIFPIMYKTEIEGGE